MTYDDLQRYVDQSVRKELENDPEGDPIFWALIATVCFYTDAWRSGNESGLQLPDQVGVAVTDSFVLEVLSEHSGESGDFENWRKSHPTTGEARKE